MSLWNPSGKHEKQTRSILLQKTCTFGELCPVHCSQPQAEEPNGPTYLLSSNTQYFKSQYDIRFHFVHPDSHTPIAQSISFAQPHSASHPYYTWTSLFSICKTTSAMRLLLANLASLSMHPTPTHLLGFDNNSSHFLLLLNSPSSTSVITDWAGWCYFPSIAANTFGFGHFSCLIPISEKQRAQTQCWFLVMATHTQLKHQCLCHLPHLPKEHKLTVIALVRHLKHPWKFSALTWE